MSRNHILPLLVSLLACGPTAPMTTSAGGTDDTAATDAATGGSSTGGASTTATPASSSSSGGGPTTDPTTGAVDSTGSTTSGGFEFIKPTDGGSCGAPAPDGTSVRCTECDPWSQNCSEGLKCTPYSSDGDNSWESLKCVPVDPNPGQVGDPCTSEGIAIGVDSCDVGMMCWNIDAMTMQGTCVGFCTGSPDNPMCPDDTTCVISNDGVLILCLPGCDPLLQDCPGVNLCINNPGDPNSFICVLDASGDEGQEYDPCEYANGCDPGLFCAATNLDGQCDPMALGCCLAFCDLSNPQCNSPAPVECVAWFEVDMAPPGYEDVGACIIPE